MRFALMLIAGIALAACAREVRVESSTTDVVTVKYFEGESSAAEAKAREECNKYGKRARFRNTSSGSTGERVGIYDCLPP